MNLGDSERAATPDGRTHEAQPAWREQFPIDWPSDEFRSRRDFTKMLGLTSLAFVAGQCWIGVLSISRKSDARPELLDLGPVDELTIGAAKRFEYPSQGHPCLLVRIDQNHFVAFGQKCTHLSCPVIPKPELGKFVCPCHHGSFDIQTGRPLAGPPRRPLPRVILEVKDGRVFATGFAEGEA